MMMVEFEVKDSTDDGRNNMLVRELASEAPGGPLNVDGEYSIKQK